MDLSQFIRNVPDYPKKGIQFKDITTLLQNPVAFQFVVDQLEKRYSDQKLDVIAGIDSRGFIFGSALAYKMGISFVPIRKKGKLPAETISVEYQLEYGSDFLEIHRDSIKENDKVLIIDDLMATGGTMGAAIHLVESLEGNIVETFCVIDLPDLGGSKKVQTLNHKFYSMIEFSGH
ncbi:MAG: adenine phosphoribosyltransferase [Bdellovibrionales bacterium]